MEDITYDKMMSVQIRADKKRLIDSYTIRMYKLPEMDDVVASDIAQMTNAHGGKVIGWSPISRFCFLN